ncbi:MAG: electron transfer flavoprotein subunit beta/FixA family protein [Clostridiales bacterium]|jgi:electron transfer flavoprotein beta subunit|nr:electron transfer flavoprotein subunit beta/FixA family protein [Clostridiales bacterium]
MKLLVCIKQVPGGGKAEIDPETGVIKRDASDAKMNPYDLYAIEAALRLKEQYGGTVRVLTMGPPQAENVIREAFSMGADEGALLTDRRFAGSDVLATGMALAQAVKALGHFDLLLCGRQTTDGDTAQVGPELAEHLGIPSAAGILEIQSVGGGHVTVKMDMPTTVETVRITLPALLCVEKDVCVPRLPSYVKKKATAQREIRVLTLDDFAERDEALFGLFGSPTNVRRIFPPESTDGREIWQGDADELAERLHTALVNGRFVERT